MNSKSNILLLHGSSDLYGASKILIYTVLSLKKNGFNVNVVLSDDGPLVQNLRDLDINVEIVRLGILRRKYFTPAGLINRLNVLKKAQKQLTEIIKKNDIGTIYSNTTAVLVGIYVAKRLRLKHIWHVHEIIEKPAFFSKFIGYLLKKSDLIIVVSQQVKKHWAKVLGEHSNRIKVIYNGLDYSPFSGVQSSLRDEIKLPEGKLLIGMIGRVNNWKGQGYFLNIAAKLLNEFDNLHFVMAGDVFPGYEYLYDELEQLKVDLNITQSVTDLGFRNDIPNILAGLDIFVLPSILPDPLPTVVLESMASSKPVVATGHGGALEMVKKDETGVFIPWDSPDKAFEIIKALILENKLKEKGINGRNRVVKEFSLDAFQHNMVEAIKQI